MNIDFPVRIGRNGCTIRSPDHAKHVRDMIGLVLFTQAGERVMHPDFGTGLLQKVFDANSPELAATLQSEIGSALTQWLGDVVDVRSVVVECRDATLDVSVVYALRATGTVYSERFERSVG
jgi:phage baseplate assembly protein W